MSRYRIVWNKDAQKYEVYDAADVLVAQFFLLSDAENWVTRGEGCPDFVEEP